MLKKSALIVSTALVLALPAGAAFAATDDDADDTATVVTCDQTQQRLQAHDGSGVANGGQAMVATQQRQRLQLDADCTGDGPMTGTGGGYGEGDCDGTGPAHEGPANGTGNQFGRAGH